MINPTEPSQHPSRPAGGYAVTSRTLDVGTCVVSLAGEIDLAAAPTLKSALLDLLRAGHRRFVLDVSHVRHIDSTGLGVLVAFQKRLRDHGVLLIADVPQTMMTVLEITGLDARLALFPTVDDAIDHAHRASSEVLGAC